MDDAQAERHPRQIAELARELRASHVPLLQNYAITVLAETRAALAHVSLTDPPDRLLERP